MLRIIKSLHRNNKIYETAKKLRVRPLISYVAKSRDKSPIVVQYAIYRVLY